METEQNRQTCVVLDLERWGTTDPMPSFINDAMDNAFNRSRDMYFILHKMPSNGDPFVLDCFNFNGFCGMPLGVIRDANGYAQSVIFLRPEVGVFAVEAERVVIVTPDEFERLIKKYPDKAQFTRRPDKEDEHFLKRFSADDSSKIVTAFMVPIDEEIEVKTRSNAGDPTIGEYFPEGHIRYWYFTDAKGQTIKIPV